MKALQATINLRSSTRIQSSIQNIPSSAFSRISFQPLYMRSTSSVFPKSQLSTFSPSFNRDHKIVFLPSDLPLPKNSSQSLSSSPPQPTTLLLFQKNTFSTSTKPSSPSPSSPPTPPHAEKVEKTHKLTFMDYVRKYGPAFLVTEVIISTICTAGLYVAIRQGVDVESLVSSLQDWWYGPHVHGETEREITNWTATGGAFALAFATNKLLMPLRTPVALALTPKVAKHFRLTNPYADTPFPPIPTKSTQSTSQAKTKPIPNSTTTKEE